jgi:hypothetical protein
MRAAIVPGVMSLSIISRLVSDWMGADGTLHSLDVSYRRPVLQNDALKLQALVTDADETPEGPRVKLDCTWRTLAVSGCSGRRWWAARKVGRLPEAGTPAAQLPPTLLTRAALAALPGATARRSGLTASALACGQWIRGGATLRVATRQLPLRRGLRPSRPR